MFLRKFFNQRILIAQKNLLIESLTLALTAWQAAYLEGGLVQLQVILAVRKLFPPPFLMLGVSLEKNTAKLMCKFD